MKNRENPVPGPVEGRRAIATSPEVPQARAVSAQREEVVAVPNSPAASSSEGRYTCGQLVAGRGRQILAPEQAIPWRNDCAFEKGVIVILPKKAGEPYTVFDQQSFLIFEAKEENLRPR